MLGKKKRMKRIMKNGKAVVVPMDHGITAGPIRGIERIEEILPHLRADAVVLHKGMAKLCDSDMALIIHASASTNLSGDPDAKTRVLSVEHAIRMGADAVSIHVNIGSDTEREQIRDLAQIAEECELWGMPLLAMMYPRGEKIKDRHSPDVIKHAVRIAEELGADIVKTNYTGSIESFAEVIDSTHLPVLIAGGPRVNSDVQLLTAIYDAMHAGAGGVAIGRNIFQHPSPESISHAIHLIVHEGATPDDALGVIANDVTSYREILA